jgi:hypothetical protein
MKATRTGPAAFLVEFETDEELREEYATNLSAGGLRLPTTEKVAPFSTLSVTEEAPGRELNAGNTRFHDRPRWCPRL